MVFREALPFPLRVYPSDNGGIIGIIGPVDGKNIVLTSDHRRPFAEQISEYLQNPQGFLAEYRKYKHPEDALEDAIMRELGRR
jgi:hypothetical protein